MVRYILKRLLQTLLVLWLVLTIVFVMMRMIGDPSKLLISPEGSSESLENLRHILGLDKSIPEQYWDYIKGIFTWDFWQFPVLQPPGVRSHRRASAGDAFAGRFGVCAGYAHRSGGWRRGRGQAQQLAGQCGDLYHHRRPLPAGILAGVAADLAVLGATGLVAGLGLRLVSSSSSCPPSRWPPAFPPASPA